MAGVVVATGEMWRGVIRLKADGICLSRMGRVMMNDVHVCTDGLDWPQLTGQVYQYVQAGMLIWNLWEEQLAGLFYGCPPPMHFMQLEPGVGGPHLHIVLDAPYMGARGWTATLKKLTAKLHSMFAECGAGEETKYYYSVPRDRHGKVLRCDEEFIRTYLLKKVPLDGVWWAWTTIDKFKPIVLSETRRRSLAAAERLNDGGTDQALVPVQPPPAKRTRASDEFVTLCNWLAQEGILTEQKWRATDLNGYVRQYASMHGRQQVAAALMMARNIILDTMANSHFLTRGPPAVVATPAWEENRVVQLLRLQGYDPRVVGQYILAWADGMTGKRNTLWLYGPPSTGKTNLANAICQCVPVYGMVNWTNENFPFNDAADKCLILWDEGRISSKIVEACKAILGGMPVRVDQKCKGSTALRPTPVLVTSNGDMTIVRDGNTSTLIHRPALKDRMVRLDFNVKLPAEYGLLTPSDVRAWLAGCRDHPPLVDAINMGFTFPVGSDAHKEDEGDDDADHSGSRLHSSPFQSRRVPDTPSDGIWPEDDESDSDAELSEGDLNDILPLVNSWESSVSPTYRLERPICGVDYVWSTLLNGAVCSAEHATAAKPPPCFDCYRVHSILGCWAVRDRENGPETGDLRRCVLHRNSKDPLDVLPCHRCTALSGLEHFVSSDSPPKVYGAATEVVAFGAGGQETPKQTPTTQPPVVTPPAPRRPPVVKVLPLSPPAPPPPSPAGPSPSPPPLHVRRRLSF